MSQVLEVAGVKLSVTPANGVDIDAGWLMNKTIDHEDALKIRDWLNQKFPVKVVK